VVMAEIFSPDALIVLLFLPVLAATLVLQVVVAVQIFSASDAAWAATGQSKPTWVVLWLAGWFCFGIVIDLVWLLAIRPKMRRAEAA
jgi:hypothetical protein